MLNRKPSPSPGGAPPPSVHTDSSEQRASAGRVNCTEKNSKHFASSSSPILLHSTSKGNVGLLLSIFLQTGAQASGGSLAKWLQRRRCVCVCGVCVGNLSTQGVVVFLQGSWAPAVPAPKKEPVETVKINNDHHLKLLECVLFICYFIRSFQAPYEIGSLLSHFINKQTEAERVSALLTTHS